MIQRTLCIIKPDAIKKNLQGNIIQKLSDSGFKILGMRMLKLSDEKAEKFYEVHKERPFYKELCSFMTSGPIVVVALEKENAVADYRTLIGATDPAEASEGTIRKLYADSKAENAVHGSDSEENGKAEVAFFFDESELC